MQSYKANSLVLFVLLTYNNQMLPVVTPDQMDDFGCSSSERVSKNASFELQGYDPTKDLLPFENLTIHPLPCFAIEHIDSFFKHLRSRLKSFFGRDVRISYFLVAENGDEKKRPHYHIILFFDLELNDFNFCYCKKFVTDSWTKRVSCDPYPVHRKNKDGKFMFYKNGKPKVYYKTTKSLSFGKVMFDEENGKQFVKLQDINKAASYLSQYLVQDPYFEDVHKRNLDQLSPRNKKIYIKRFGAFRLCSKFFGIRGLLHISDNDIRNCQIRLKGVDHPYRMPLYYQRYVYTDQFRLEVRPDSLIRLGSYKEYPLRPAICRSRPVYHQFNYFPEKRNFKVYQFKNKNWYNLKIAQFDNLYESLFNSFSAFLSFFKQHNFSVGSPYYSVFHAILSTSSVSRSSRLFAFLSCDSLSVLIDQVDFYKLIGYYLLFFNNYKAYDQIPDKPTSFSYTPYVWKHLGERDFIRRTYSDQILLSLKAPFADHDLIDREKHRVSDDPLYETKGCMNVYEFFCLLFHAYQHEHLNRINLDKVSEWNNNAESLRKAKYKIRCY